MKKAIHFFFLGLSHFAFAQQSISTSSTAEMQDYRSLPELPERMLGHESGRIIKDCRLHSLAKKTADEKSYNELLTLLNEAVSLEQRDKNGDTPLMVACSFAHQKACLALLDKGASIHSFNSKGWSPLHLAAVHNDETICKNLIERGADINAVTQSRGDTVLHIACRGGNDRLCRYLLSCNPRTDIKNRDEKRAIDCAFDHEDIAVALVMCEGSLSKVIQNTICRNRPTILEKLLDYSSDLKKDLFFANGSTALHWAAACEKNSDDTNLEQGVVVNSRKVSPSTLDPQGEALQRKMIILLLEKAHMPVDLVDKYGRTALHIATEWGRNTACLTLIEKNSSLNKTVCSYRVPGKSFSPPILAAVYDNQVILKYFCDFLVNTQKIDDLALFYPAVFIEAIDNQSSEVVKVLLTYRKRFSALSNKIKKFYPLHRASLSGASEICTLLLDEGADADEVMDLTKNQQGEFGTFWLENDRKGITPLHCASLAGHQEICETLFRRNVDLNKKTDNGKTPLLFAALRNHDALVSLFIAKDAEIDSGVLEYSRAELCSTLLDTIKNRCEIQKDQKNSAQIINKVDSQGKTLLHKEAEKGNFEKCASLLNHFAKLAVVDSQQRTPLHLACQAAVDKRDFLVNHYLMTVLVLLNDLQGSDLGFINAQDKNGETALHYACKGGSSLVHIVQLLLSKGAYPQLVSQGLFGKTARTIANDSGSTALIALFEINE